MVEELLLSNIVVGVIVVVSVEILGNIVSFFKVLLVSYSFFLFNYGL